MINSVSKTPLLLLLWYLNGLIPLLAKLYSVFEMYDWRLQECNVILD